MTADSHDPEDDLIEDVAGFTHDPKGFMRYAYEWNEGELLEEEGPRDWQDEVNEIIGVHLGNPKTRYEPLMIGVASGHGIGKSAEIGMLLNWAMSTCEDCKVLLTANTDTQLRTKTMPEVGKWFRRSITADWFDVTATAVAAKEKGHEKTWRVDAIPWSLTNTEAFAGIHNKGKRIIIVMDEGSGIPDKIYEVVEGALTDENTEIIWIVFGNFTRAAGRFADIFGKLRHRWKQFQIDARTVKGTNKVQIQKWLEDYGEDSDFFKVRVRGMPPSASQKQFISTTDVDAAFGKHLREESYAWAPKIISVDPAWEGDDEFVIGLRQGLMFKVLGKYPKNDNDVQMANIIARFEDDLNADAVFIDGGYGTGIVSVGKTLKRQWQLVWFSEKPIDLGCLNKRAEMWKLMRDWLKAGGTIPNDPMLHAELIGPETVARLDGKLQIESKDDMKSRGLRSPNRADALAITFAYPVSSKVKIGNAKRGGMLAEYDPFK